MINDQKTKWNQFIVQNSGSFLQSWQWGDFQEALGRKIWRIEIHGLKGLVIRHDLPFGKNYLYCPRGPIGEITNYTFQAFLEKVKKIAEEEKSIFLKIEPQNNFQFSIFNFQKSQKQIQPQKTLILDITKSEEELLKQMHQKTRYNIGLAQKKGVVVEISNSESQAFFGLLKQTAKQDKFHLHPKEYYQKMLEFDIIKLFLAKYQDKIIVANLVCFFGDTAVYLHGASDYNYRHLMAPYLLQWQAIYQARKQGLRYYDFWGIDEKRWPGVTRFKKGFGGQETVYPGVFDLIFRPWWYQAYNLARIVL